MAIEFYDVKTRQKVSVEESKVKKVVYHPKGTGGPRYGLRAEHDETSAARSSRRQRRWPSRTS